MIMKLNRNQEYMNARNCTFVYEAIHFYNIHGGESKMAFIDIWEEEYFIFRSFIITRIDEVPAKELAKVSERYQEMIKKEDELLEKFKFIYDVVENTGLNQDTFSRKELKALQEYLNCAKTKDDYQRFEIYKLGFHDCIIWLQMIGIL